MQENHKWVVSSAEYPQGVCKQEINTKPIRLVLCLSLQLLTGRQKEDRLTHSYGFARRHGQNEKIARFGNGQFLVVTRSMGWLWQ